MQIEWPSRPARTVMNALVFNIEQTASHAALILEGCVIVPPMKRQPFEIVRGENNGIE
jgi:hypothetical protein